MPDPALVTSIDADVQVTILFAAILVSACLAWTMYANVKRERWITAHGIADPRRNYAAPWRPRTILSMRQRRLQVVIYCLFTMLQSAVLGFILVLVVTQRQPPEPLFAEPVDTMITVAATFAGIAVPFAIALYLHTQRADFLHHRSQSGNSFVPAMLTGHAGITRRSLPATRLTAQIEYNALQLAFAFFWVGGLIDLVWDATGSLR